MTTTDEVLKANEIEHIAEEIEQRLDGEAGKHAAEFARAYYGPIAPEDVKNRSRANLAGAALNLWAWGRNREPGELLVRIYNPHQEDHGWESDHTVVELINDDMPFLVDSVSVALAQRKLDIHLVIHPIVAVRRDEDGRRTALVTAEAGTALTGAELVAAREDGGDGGVYLESYIHVEVDRIGDAGEREELRQELLRVMTMVRAAVEDWKSMLSRLDAILEELRDSSAPIPEEETEETIAFLEWLRRDHFTFLGYRRYELERDGGRHILHPVDESGLGVLRGSLRIQPPEPRELTPAMIEYSHRPESLFITKTNNRSLVHRPVHMDYIGIKRYDDEGKVIGEHRLVGLFTSLSYRRLASEVPLLRRKVNRVLERASFAPRSHDGKSLLHILETLPRDELFQMDVDQLYDTALGVLQLQERRQLALFVRKDLFERFVACTVYVPRDRYNTALRLRMVEILEKAFAGVLGATYTQMGDEPLARLQFFIATTPGEVPAFDAKAIESALADAANTWADGLHQVLVEEWGEDVGLALARRYDKAFPLAYQEDFEPQSAKFDIRQVEELKERDGLGLTAYRPVGEPRSTVHFKVYSVGEPRPLSEVVPIFENLGFNAVAERPYEIEPEGDDRPVWVRDFELVARDGRAVDLRAVREGLLGTFERVWAGEVEDDAFNHLVLSAGLDWREVVILRAYCRYLRQTGIAFSQVYMAQTLAGNPEISRHLVDLFRVRFDPDLAATEVESRVHEIQAFLRDSLDAVANVDEDRILRRFLNLIRSTLRTNYFQVGEDGEAKSYLSFKLDSAAVDELPKPRPLYEIFVYSSRVEAVHLRGGLVARGGIRWSDRPEDFRTEVLGLMKAQMVKNAVIVPVGSKGGFVVKRAGLFTDRAALMEEAVECYKIMMRGLLDLTDNYQGDQVVPPERVVRKDGDDPYLVVAADKGTATFSDLANGVAAEYGFWLGDAFASGGSAGYDHKAMGITARGAWEAVKRHFREMGRNIQEEDFTVVGVGDMSGDVFGNGMLLSRHIRLVGAFNHLHVFVDPNPDPEISYAERERLFHLPRSSWSDYNPEAISAGGGVFDRKAKTVPISPQIAKALDIKEETLTPSELIRAVLRAQVDLLWFGGIGTYVKAVEESHAEVGDRANDALRLNATEVRAKVVGEGANLGFTQRGRIEYALEGGPDGAGGRLNTDAIDNSGGVDCSDHEVNIKILLNEVVAAGDLTGKQRDKLLEQMTEEVAELVLRDNYLQTQALSVAEAQGPKALIRQARLIRDLERTGNLDRAIEHLPDEEALTERKNENRGLTRPELAVLLAYSKISLFQKILASSLPDDPLLMDDLPLYFPKPLQERFAQEISAHRLRREIAATFATNSLINRLGPTFMHRIEADTGCSPGEITRAYTLARDSFELRALWRGIESLDNQVPAATQMAMILRSKVLIERATRWLLHCGDRRGRATVEVLRPGIAGLAANIESLLPKADRNTYLRDARRLTEEGVPEELARQVAALDFLAAALDIVAIAEDLEIPVEDVGRVYYLLGARFSLDWLRDKAHGLPADTPWQREATAKLVDDLFAYQSALAKQVLRAVPDASSGRDAIDAWSDGNRRATRRTRSLLSGLKKAGTPDLAMVSVATHHIGELAGRPERELGV